MPSIDPKEIAIEIAKAIGNGVLGKGGGMLLDSLISLLGLAAETMEDYYKKLQSQLSVIQNTQSEMKEMLQSILQAQTEVKAQIEDATLRSALQRFASNRNTIASNYASLTQSIIDLTKDCKRASDEIYQVLVLSNTNRIDEAMRNIHDEVAGETESKGMIAMQEAICRQALAAWAKKPENVVTTNYTGRYGFLYDWFPAFPNNTLILKNGFNEAIPAVLESTVIPMFHAFLAIQLQGLLILQSAWGKTSQAARLNGHAANKPPRCV